MENRAVSVLDKPAAVLTVVDVYEIAAVLGQEFERMIDKFGCDALVALVPRVVRVLELLEALVSRGATGQEAEDLRRELDRLRQERSDKHEQERKHQKVSVNLPADNLPLFLLPPVCVPVYEALCQVSKKDISTFYNSAFSVEKQNKVEKIQLKIFVDAY